MSTDKPIDAKAVREAIREAYCENESIYGFGCGVAGCPHCGGRSDGNPYCKASAPALGSSKTKTGGRDV